MIRYPIVYCGDQFRFEATNGELGFLKTWYYDNWIIMRYLDKQSRKKPTIMLLFPIEEKEFVEKAIGRKIEEFEKV